MATSTRFYHRPVAPLPDPSTLPFPGNLICNCHDCGLRDGATRPVPGDGPIPSEVMLTGQNPGFSEDQNGKPFIGASGQYLDSLLFAASIPRDMVYITNLVHCMTSGNRPPKPAEIFTCRKWLDIELSAVDPLIIVAMGAPAIAHFLGTNAGTVEHLHGKPVEVVIDGKTRIILPCYHPAAALRDTTLIRQCSEDFNVLRGLIKGHSPSDYIVQDEYPNPEYRVADTPKLLAQVVSEIREVGQVAIDVETIHSDTQLWSAQISTRPGTAWFIPVGSDFKGRMDTTKWNAEVIIHHYLNDVKWLDIPANNFFDTMVASYLLGQAQGLKELASRLCGMRMINYSEMVRPGQHKLAVQYLTEAATREWPDPVPVEEVKWDNKAGKIVSKLRKPWHISRKMKGILADAVNNPSTDAYKRWREIEEVERLPVEKKLGLMPESSLADISFVDAVQYAAKDSDATMRVKLKLEKMLTDAGLDFVFHVDTAILPMVREMMDNGMPVDVDYFQSLSTDYAKRMALKADELAAMVGHPFNPSSSTQVATVVYGELGFKPTAFTPGKEISTDDQELKKVKHPASTGIILYRRMAKLKGTYSDNMVKSAHPDANGVQRMHTVITTTRVETGRLSSKKDDNGDGANLQNIPTRGKEGKAIKKGFIASPGKILAEGDLGQIEICTQAHLANCRGLIELFSRGGDPHTETAARLFGVPLEEAKKDKYRYPCKRAGFGIIYLIGPQGLANQIQEYIADLAMEGEPIEIDAWTEDECARFITEYYKLYPEIRDYQYEQAAMARRHGYVVDLFNRRRYIPELQCPIQSVQEEGKRKAANFPVTATAQEIIKTAMGRLWREIQGTEWQSRSLTLMQIHDSLVDELDDDEKFIREFLTWKRDVMTGVVKLRVPVKVDFKVGYNWAELKKYEFKETAK